MQVILPLVILLGILAWLLKPGKSPTKVRIIAIQVTVIPQVAVVIAAVAFQLQHNAAGKTWVSDTANTCFLIGLGLIGAAILVSIGYTIARKGEIAKGVGFGICIALLVSIINFGLLEWLGGV